MAEDNKIIAATIQVDTGNSGAEVKSLNTDTSNLKKSLADTGATAQKTGKDVQQTGGSFAKLKGEIGSMPGPLGAAGEGVNKLNQTFKALIKNPLVLVITLIVGALALLYKAFTSTNDGADKMEQIFKGVGAVVDVIRDRILKAAGAIVKFFKGDWSGALDDAKAAVTGFGDEVASEFRKAADAVRSLQEVEDAMRGLGVARAKLNRDLAETKEIISDENASLEDKKRAIEEVRKKEGEQTAQELANAKKKLEAIRQLNALSDTSDEDLDKEAQAEAELYRIQEQAARDKRTLNKEEKRVESEERAKAKEAQAAAIEAQKEQRQKLVEFTNKLTKIQQENELLTIKDGYEKQKKELENKIADEKRENELAFKDRKITRQQFNELQNALDIRANLQRKELTEKNNLEIAEKEAEFQKVLNGISTSIRLAGIKDSRELERVQLKLGYEEKLQDAIKQYKDDQDKFNQVKNLLDEQQRIEQAKLDEKFKLEDDKKAFEIEDARLKAEIEKKDFEFEAKREAADLDQQLIQEAFDNKLISEVEYNAKVKDLADKRMMIAELEMQHKKNQVSEVAGIMSGLAELVGKQTIAGKALGIATALINTYQGASEAIKQKSVLPSPFDVVAKAVNVATVVATGLKTVKSIAAVQVPGGGGGGNTGSAPSISAPAPIAPTQASTKIDTASIEGIGNAAAGGVNRDVRAFVLDSDVDANRTRNERLNRAARLGG